MDWLIARGAMDDQFGGGAPEVNHRFYHVPASNTAVGHLVVTNPVAPRPVESESVSLPLEEVHA